MGLFYFLRWLTDLLMLWLEESRPTESGPDTAQAETTATAALIKKLSTVKHSLSVAAPFACHQSAFNI